jgi:hypothetical protein
MSFTVRIAIILLCAYAGSALGTAQFEELPEVFPVSTCETN